MVVVEVVVVVVVVVLRDAVQAGRQAGRQAVLHGGSHYFGGFGRPGSRTSVHEAACHPRRHWLSDALGWAPQARRQQPSAEEARCLVRPQGGGLAGGAPLEEGAGGPIA